MNARSVIVAAMLVLGVPAMAAPGAPAVAGKNVDARLLDAAQALIRQHQPAAAITRILDPLIARLTASLASEKRLIYAARTPVETLLYASMAAAAKQAAVVLGPSLPDAYFYKGFALVDLGRATEARTWFEKAVALSPMNARYLSELANLSQTDKDWPKALELYGSAVAGARTASPRDARTAELTRALRGEGFVLVELDRLDEAEARYRECLRLDPGDRVARAELGYIAERRVKRPPVA